RRRALKRLDGARVIVRLHLKHHAQAVADVHGAGVFARPLYHARTSRRQLLEELARVLVAAVLAPHRAEHPQLEQVRLTAESAEDELVFSGKESKRAQTLLDRSVGSQRHVNAGSLNATSSDSKMNCPSVLPSSASAARSGWGIKPKT